MTKTINDGDANLSDFQIWPLGYGAVLSAIGEDEAAGVLFFCAVADQYVGEPRDLPGENVWDEMIVSPAPKMALHFANTDAVEHLIETLVRVKSAMMDREQLKGDEK